MNTRLRKLSWSERYSLREKKIAMLLGGYPTKEGMKYLKRMIKKAQGGE